MSNIFSVRPKQDDLINKLMEEPQYKYLLQDFYKEYEIGQSSVGWKFLFYQSITLRKMLELSHYYEIVDEYGKKYTYQEFKDYVLCFKDGRTRENTVPYDWFDQGDYDVWHRKYDIPEWWKL